MVVAIWRLSSCRNAAGSRLSICSAVSPVAGGVDVLRETSPEKARPS